MSRREAAQVDEKEGLGKEEGRKGGSREEDRKGRRKEEEGRKRGREGEEEPKADEVCVVAGHEASVLGTRLLDVSFEAVPGEALEASHRNDLRQGEH